MDTESKPINVGGVAQKVLAVIPCLNEETHLEGIVRGLLRESGEIDLHIVIADGGSADGSVAIAKRLAASQPSVTYFHNEKKIQSAAVNRAVRLCSHGRDYLIRVDAHCRYPDRYCQQLLAAQKKSGAASVAVRMEAEGHTCFQRAAAVAQNSLLGNGGSAHRMSSQGRFVDHGHHALIALPAFLAVGGYDESFSHNEDAEFDTRLRRRGYTIWLMAEAPIGYFPRSAAWPLLRQYMNHGRGRAKTILKHRLRPKLRQSLPLGVGPAVALLPLGLLQPIAAVPCMLWAALCVAYGAVLGIRFRDLCAGASGFTAMIMHFGWSVGFFTEVWRQVWSRPGKTSHELAADPRYLGPD